jgi:hypothetical protein
VPYLLKNFKPHNLIFMDYRRSCRMIIEHTFGDLKKKWRNLKSLVAMLISTPLLQLLVVYYIITVCCKVRAYLD